MSELDPPSDVSRTAGDRPALVLGDDERRFIHATWSRSGKRAILSVGRSWDSAGQVELTPEQASQLAAFLTAGQHPPLQAR
jgi:hypothetical protein